ncbi:MAG: hypothetical protein AAGF26_06355 [Cyanobacteria bacterium P01_G01_bin.49]
MSIKRAMFDTVVIITFLSATSLLFNYVSGTSFSNPLLGNTVQTEEEA